MDNKLKLIADSIDPRRFKWNEGLKSHTFSKSEGVAQCFYIATNKRELIQVLDATEDLGVSYFIIGAGTKIILNSFFSGLVIKNRTSSLKMAGVKGKIQKGGLGIEEAFVEADSGVSLNKLNEFVRRENLKTIDGFSSLHSTVGGAIFLDPQLRGTAQSLKIWEAGENREIKIDELKKSHVVLSVIFKFKAKQ